MRNQKNIKMRSVKRRKKRKKLTSYNPRICAGSKFHITLSSGTVELGLVKTF